MADMLRTIVLSFLLAFLPASRSRAEDLNLAHYQGIFFSGSTKPVGCVGLDYCAMDPNTKICPPVEVKTTGGPGAGWYEFVADRLTLPGQFCVYGKPEVMGMAPGVYPGGSITLKSDYAVGEIRVNVSLTICPLPPSFRAFPTEVTFEYDLGLSGPPTPAYVSLVGTSSGGTGPTACATAIQPAFTTAVSTQSGGNWLSARPLTGGPEIEISVGSSSEGTHEGAVTSSCNNCSPPGPASVVVPVHLNVLPRRPPEVKSVWNAASYNFAYSPNSWISVYGKSLADSTRSWQQADFDGQQLPASLDQVRVMLNGAAAAIAYISPTQINALIPPDLPPGPVTITVSNSHGTGGVVQGTVTKYAPEFFRAGLDALGHPSPSMAAVTPDGALVGGSRPAVPGERILLFGTGFGPTDPPAAPNQLLPQPLPLAAPDKLEIDMVGVTVDGRSPVTVEWAGLVMPGVYQFNVIVPDVATGQYNLIAKIDGMTNKWTPFLNVRR